eukprot:CAMPEP_0185492568 /NCGR_PEP_ID=MMETSP1366-20130426/15532_1 /TAXON_ID=38817 /ORGANISM="Gephyrocapsa oceanica, Strain RCC1303" /LENGTH=181 /DNA_ID=CAMNT_0028101411 /DNA_START=121 /DNA_END=661 /DNA_ORIENTATION=-
MRVEVVGGGGRKDASPKSAPPDVQLAQVGVGARLGDEALDLRRHVEGLRREILADQLVAHPPQHSARARVEGVLVLVAAAVVCNRLVHHRRHRDDRARDWLVRERRVGRLELDGGDAFAEPGRPRTLAMPLLQPVRGGCQHDRPAKRSHAHHRPAAAARRLSLRTTLAADADAATAATAAT